MTRDSGHGDGHERATHAGGSDRILTGNPSLDLILGGGIPRESLTIIAGAPGAGKTILAQQIAFAAAHTGMRVIYFTNVSEPHAKLISHIRDFGFFQPELVGQNIQIYNITSHIRDRGLRETLSFIVETVRGEAAGLVVIDSFRGLKHVLAVGTRDRSAIFDLAAQLSILGCTTLLIGEYTQEESLTDPEFAVADGILHLHHSTIGTQDRRWLRVVKMRGVHYLSGEHSFAITQRGIEAYPRQETLASTAYASAADERTSCGIAKLDEMLGGGLLRASSTLVAGSAGSGKTLLALHYLAAGAAQGERGLMVTFQESPALLRQRASQFGIAQHLGQDGQHLTQVLAIPPVEIDLDIVAASIRQSVEQHEAQHLVIDSVAELESASRNPDRFDDFMASLVGYLRERHVNTIMTRELTQIFGSELAISNNSLSFIADSIILLRYLEVDSQIRRAITVLKSRGSRHDSHLRSLHIDNGKIAIGSRLDNLSGVLSGQPTALGPGRGSQAKEGQP